MPRRSDGSLTREIPTLRRNVFAYSIRLSWRASPRQSLLLAGVIGFNALISALLAVALSSVITSAQAGQAWPTLLAVSLGVVSVTQIELGFRMQFSLRLHLASAVEDLVKTDLARELISVPSLEAVSGPDSQVLIESIRRDAGWIADAAWTAGEMLSIVVQIALSVWLLSTVQPSLAFLPFLAVPGALWSRKVFRLESQAQRESAAHYGAARQLRDTIADPNTKRQIPSVAAYDYLLDRWAWHWAQAAEIKARAQVKSVAIRSAGTLLFTAGFLVALTWVVHAVLVGRLEPATVIMVIILIGRLQGQVGHGLWLLGRFNKSLVVAHQFQHLSDVLSRFTGEGGLEAPSGLTSGIQLEHVSFRYPGETRLALEDVSVFLPSGKTVAVVGGNGAGKTTLALLLLGAYTPTEGDIQVDGVSIRELDRWSWWSRIASQQQDHARFHLSLHDNVGVGNLFHSQDLTRVISSLLKGGGGHLLSNLPAGLQTRLGERFNGTELSKGQWQQVALARAHMRMAPVLLILDEPSASLDPHAEFETFRIQADLSKATQHGVGGVTVLISHRFANVRDADLILVLHEGRLVESGSHGQLLGLCGRYARMYRMQADGYE